METGDIGFNVPLGLTFFPPKPTKTIVGKNSRNRNPDKHKKIYNGMFTNATTPIYYKNRINYITEKVRTSITNDTDYQIILKNDFSDALLIAQFKLKYFNTLEIHSEKLERNCTPQCQ